MRRETVVRQGFPVGKIHHHAFRKLADFVMQTQRILHIRGDQHHRAIMALCDFGNFSRARRAGEFTKLALIASFYR
ncbi:hypothetical protein D3C75_752980 [compost metagenome]